MVRKEIPHHYTVNVSHDGRHFFGTHARSATTEQEAKELFKEIKKRFPEKDGYEVTINAYVEYAYTVNFK